MAAGIPIFRELRARDLSLLSLSVSYVPATRESGVRCRAASLHKTVLEIPGKKQEGPVPYHTILSHLNSRTISLVGYGILELNK